MISDEELKFRIAVTQIPEIGPVLAKNLISYCGSATEVFRQSKAKLIKIPGIGLKTAEKVLTFTDFKRAEDEVGFIKKHKIKPLFYADADFPHRLKNNNDAPVLLYYLGNADLNQTRIVSIVGTRLASDYGKRLVHELVEGLKPYNCLVISGLAYGIDITTHKACLENGVATLGILAHGLDRIYPAIHTNTAKKMLENGGLITEYISETTPDRKNFPNRNRIVAGMSDAVIVVETDIKGGSMITAELGNAYNRDVFAIPGRTDDEKSKGCHYLIKTNRAALIEDVDDIAFFMGWDLERAEKKKPSQITFQLSEPEATIYELLKDKQKLGIDEICHQASIPVNEAAITLLDLEFKGVIKSLPGKMYGLV